MLNLGLLAALSTAVFFGLSQTVVRIGLRYGSSLDAANISVKVSLLILWPLALIYTDFSRLDTNGILIFVLAGLLAPTLGRLLRFMGIERLGAVESAPLAATSPLFATVIAVLLLGEESSTAKALGTVLTVAGTMILSLKGFSVKKAGIAAMLISAAMFGIAENMRRAGLLLIPSPALGAALGSSVAAVTYSFYGTITHRAADTPKEAKRYFYVAGIVQTLGQLSLFISLMLLGVSVAAPIFRTDTLFTDLFAHIMLRGVEKVTFRAVISALIIITGITLLVS